MPKKKILFQLNYLYHLPAVEPIIQLFANDPNYDVVYQINLDFKYRFGLFRKRVDQQEYNKYFPDNVRSIEKNEHFTDRVIDTVKRKIDIRCDGKLKLEFLLTDKIEKAPYGDLKYRYIISEIANNYF